MAVFAAPVLALGALLVEAGFGYPAVVFRVAQHPVVWIGALIGRVERRWNWPGAGRGVGAGALAGVVLVVGGVGVVLAWAAGVAGGVGFLVEVVLASTLLAQRSLYEHVAAVARARSIGLAREAVSRIVGRDTGSLDEAGVARAAIESLAENFADGVVAPAFWCLVGGLPGIAVYKAVNTADSMIGHRTARYERFGWAAARLDDWVNLPASRLAALFLVLAAVLVPGARAAGGWRAVVRDARRHRSPNAGWPEAAMAGALGLRLAGPRVYGGIRVEDGWMGDGRAEATSADIERALGVYRVACGLQILVAGVLAVIALG